MFDPMLARLASCLVFAGLLGGLLLTVAASDEPAPRDVVAAAELEQRVANLVFPRQ